MATVTGLTAARMAEIEGLSVVEGEVVGDDLILKRFNESTFNAGNVRGPEGPPGTTTPTGPAGGDLVGTYPNPTIRATLNNPAAGTPGLRSLGTGATNAAAGNHKHTADDVAPRMAKMARVASQNFPSGTTTNVSFDTTFFNEGFTTSSSGIVIPIDGYYTITGKLGLANSGTTGIFMCSIIGNTIRPTITFYRGGWSTSAPTVSAVATALYCEQGEVIGLSAFHSNGGTITNFTTSTAYEIDLSVKFEGLAS